MPERQAYDIRSFAKAYGISRSQAYVEIKAGRIAIFKVGRRTLISSDAAKTWRRRLEDARALSLQTPAGDVRQAQAPCIATRDDKSRRAGAEANETPVPLAK